ncbi:disease resistance protein RGA2-like [Arachis ipaensis]|uniref:disease resistance protein RGA2-like n=1 Tax=Arachis ipaensis TaxID=130454 RepID=UPI0007AF9DF9|nr:disease resistance protein RGA2-like [Arachis ipaensis]
MANGFVSSEGTMTVEDVAEEIISELCWASFFQDIEKDDLGKVRCFKIHDLLHDLAQYVMGDVCCTVNDEMPIEHPKRTRHLTIWPYAWKQINSACQFGSLRTCRFQPANRALLSPNVLRPLESLRALDLANANRLNMLHLSVITHFKYLRYLNLSRTSIKKLPESTSSLCNLQVLNLNDCDKLQQLPRHLKYLKALRHLYLRWCSSLVRMPHEIGQLTSLKTLNIYIVGKKKGLRLDELEQLCLRGELHIKNLERVRDAADAKKANLMVKQLNELLLEWGRNEQSKLQQNVEQILKALEPHPKLIKLEVGGYQGNCFPDWMGNPDFKNLCFMKLVDCWNSQKLAPLGRLPSLKRLVICCMHNLKYVDDESYDGGVARGFQSLEYLVLSCMPNLEGLSKVEEVGMFPHLTRLHVRACPKLTFPSLPSVRQLSLATHCKCSVGSVSQQVLIQIPLTMGSCNTIQLDSLGNLSCLEQLYLSRDRELSSFPVGMFGDLACLRKLHIVKCSKMEALPSGLANCIALEELSISSCHSLESLTGQVLNVLCSLRKLEIVDCDKFKGLSASFQCLTSLQHMRIEGCSQVTALSEDLQHMPPVLKSITLRNLQNLEHMPNCWASVRSLQYLYIEDCPQLRSLPLCVGGWLHNLKTFAILNCPELQNPFQRETGQDWHWIRHIPDVFV